MIHFIKNSDNENLCVQIFEPVLKTGQTKFSVICHGITGYKEQEIILQTAETLSNLGYTVLTFDCRNSRGESFNSNQCATLTSMEEDLQTVINWAQQQDFYTQPFLLAGHSLGGSVVLDYAQKHAGSISHLILLSTIFDGNEYLQNLKEYAPEFLNQLQSGGTVRARNNINCFLDDSFLQDLIHYDLYKNINALTMPVLIITGDKDTSSTSKNNRHFQKCLLCPHKFSVLSDCTHIYDKLQNQQDLDTKIQSFLLNPL